MSQRKEKDIGEIYKNISLYSYQRFYKLFDMLIRKGYYSQEEQKKTRQDLKLIEKTDL